MKKYDAIVVGSGIGGMAAGVLMAHQGKKVLMVEKHDCLGGRVSAYKKGEFNFDLGVHIISRGNKGPLGEVLRRVGAENNLEYTNVRPLSSYDGKTFIFPHDLATMVPRRIFSVSSSSSRISAAIPTRKSHSSIRSPLRMSCTSIPRIRLHAHASGWFAQFTPACLTGKQAPENLCAACAGNPPQELRAIPKAAARLSPIHTARHSQSSAVR